MSKYLSGQYAVCPTQMQWLDIQANGYVFDKLRFNIGSFRQLVQSNITGYFTNYDQFKCIKVKRTYWLNDSDEYTKADSKVISFAWTYDADGGTSIHYQVDTQMRDPRTHYTLMMPGKRYSISMRPRYAVVNETNAPSLMGFNRYWDIQRIPGASDTAGSNNAIFVTFRGDPEAGAINYQDRYYFHFKGRRNNNAPDPTITDNKVEIVTDKKIFNTE